MGFLPFLLKFLQLKTEKVKTVLSLEQIRGYFAKINKLRPLSTRQSCLIYNTPVVIEFHQRMNFVRTIKKEQ